MKVLVVGATGRTGQEVVRALVERGIAVRAMVRDAVTARESLPEAIEIVTGDLYQPASLTAALEGCTAIVSAAGARPSIDLSGPLRVDFWGTRDLVEAAKQNGNVSHFILVSSLCVSRLFHPLNLFGLILFWKRQGEAHLEASGLNYTIVRPGGLRSQDSDEGIVLSGADTLFDGGIPRAKVAQVCVEALLQPTASNKIVEIVASPEASTTIDFAAIAS
ncbi:MAG: SDR family oxidoreductase [Cyanobacteria bacterium J06641_5]